jgi:hypothetical protein
MDEAQAGVVAAPPPPPSEVKIRTMRSDLASMTKTGGGLPQFENVKFSGPSAGRGESGANFGARFKNKSDIALIGAFVAVLIALSIVGWFLYQKFSAIAPPAQPSSSQTQANQSSSASQAQSGLVPIPSSTPFVGQ